MGLLSGFKSLGKSIWNGARKAGRKMLDWASEEVPVSAPFKANGTLMNSSPKVGLAEKAYNNISSIGESLDNRVSSVLQDATAEGPGLSFGTKLRSKIDNIKGKIQGASSSSNVLRRGGTEPGEFKSLLGDSPTNWSREVQGLGPEPYEISHKDIDILFAQQDADKAATKELQERLARQSPAERNVTRNRVSEIQKQAALEKEQAAKTTKNLEVFDSMSPEEQAVVATQYGYEGDITGYRNSLAGKPKEPINVEGTTATKASTAEAHPLPSSSNIDNAAATGRTVLKSNRDPGVPNNSTDSQFAKHAGVAFAGLTAGVGITYALTRNRGQQSNAQLYGQQPLY